MAKQLVDTTTNNGTHIGDPAKTAFEKVNANFNELYPAALPESGAEKAAVRARLGLGSAATQSVAVSQAYPTNGHLLRVGDLGWGPNGVALYEADGITTLSAGQYYDGAGPRNALFQVTGTNTLVMSAGSIGNKALLSIRRGTGVPVRAWFGGYSASDGVVYEEGIHTGNASALPITGSLSPATDNAVSYGTAARRPTQLFAATATIGTSDAREKTPVRALTEAEYAVGLQLAREIGAYRWLEAVERKGEGAREHFGQTVQRAIEIFQQHGLDPFAYGAICYDSWEQETVEHPAQYEQIEIPAVLDEQGNEIAPARYEQGALIREAWTEVTLEAGDRYSWRDSELFWLICAAQQRQADEQAERQADILARLEALEQGA